MTNLTYLTNLGFTKKDMKRAKRRTLIQSQKHASKETNTHKIRESKKHKIRESKYKQYPARFFHRLKPPPPKPTQTSGKDKWEERIQ